MPTNYNLANDVHVDAFLSNISVAYFQDPDRYVADKVFPRVPVQKKSDFYWKFDKADLLRDEAERRAELAPAAEVNAKLDKDSYETYEYAAKRLISDEVMANYDQPLDPRRNAIQVVTQKLRTRLERQFADDFFGTGKWATDHTGVASNPSGTGFLQLDLANSSPLDLVAAMQEDVASAGYEANTLVVGRKVWSVLRRHPEIIDLIKFDGQGGGGTRQQLTEQAVAGILDVDRLLVARAAYNSAQEGAADNYQDIIGNSMLLVYTTDAPALETATAGYIFEWTGISDGIGTNIATKEYRIEERSATAIESKIAFVNKIVAPDLGSFATSVLSS
jgi:hypothetical protein